MACGTPLGLRGLTGTTAAVSVGVGAILLSTPASAHVHVDADDPVRGGSTTLTFRVPNESGSGSPTIGLQVDLPDLTSVSTAAAPGWTVGLDKDPQAGTVRSITWSAQPGNGIAADQFGLFVIRAQLPDSATVSFPTTQTYADGTVVHWNEAPPLAGGEAEHPAPSLTLGATSGYHEREHPHRGALEEPPAAPASPAPEPDGPHPGTGSHGGAGPGPDNAARALGGAALLLAALAVAIGLARRRA
jgi:uncharacterized protein YcnI